MEPGTPPHHSSQCQWLATLRFLNGSQKGAMVPTQKPRVFKPSAKSAVPTNSNCFFLYIYICFKQMFQKWTKTSPKGGLKKSSNSGKIFARYLLLSTLGPRVRQRDETKVLQYHKSSKANSLLGSLRSVGFPFPQFVSIYVGLSPPPSKSHHQDYYIFRIGNPYQPSFATVTGRGDNPKYMPPSNWIIEPQGSESKK